MTKNQRLPKGERVRQVVEQMQVLRANSRTQSDFTQEKVSGAVGLTRTWFIRLVGNEWRALRDTLPGPNVSRDEEIAALREEVAELKAQLERVNNWARDVVKKELAGAVAQNEILDAENRALRERLAGQMRRSSERDVHVYLPARPTRMVRSAAQNPLVVFPGPQQT